MRLHPSLLGDAAIALLAERWRASGGNVRIEPFLEEGAAETVLEALEREPFVITSSTSPTIDFQYWKLEWRAEPSCEHVLCRLGRFLHREAAEWASRVTGIALGPPEEPLVAASLFAKGSYLDTHNDWGKGRAVAYVFGLTKDRWDAEAGGHLEFVDGPEGARVLERRGPAWNTLDLFDVREPVRWHRVPIMKEHRSRWVISGWFYPRP